MNSSADHSATPTSASSPSSAKAARVAEAIRSTGLCLITDDRLELPALLSATREALDAGVRLLQYRNKRLSRRAYLGEVIALQELCREFDALFIVNDYPDIAAVIYADGIHVGQDDLPPALTRTIVGEDLAIGLSISYREEAIAARAEGVVDYIGCGAVFPTQTKPDAEFGGLELLREVRSILSVPILGIGGITAKNLHEPLRSGADGVALVSAVYGSDAPGDAAQAILQRIAQIKSG